MFWSALPQYVVLKRDDEWLAINSQNASPNLLYDLGQQGFSYYDRSFSLYNLNVSAENPAKAIEIAKNTYSDEFNKLRAKINEMEKGSVDINEKVAREILGLDENSSQDDIRKNFRKLAKILHPDGGGTNFLFDLLEKARSRLEGK